MTFLTCSHFDGLLPNYQTFIEVRKMHGLDSKISIFDNQTFPKGTLFGLACDYLHEGILNDQCTPQFIESLFLNFNFQSRVNEEDPWSEPYQIYPKVIDAQFFIHYDDRLKLADSNKAGAHLAGIILFVGLTENDANEHKIDIISYSFNDDLRTQGRLMSAGIRWVIFPTGTHLDLKPRQLSLQHPALYKF